MRRNYRIKLGLGYDEAKFNYLNNSQFSCFYKCRIDLSLSEISDEEVDYGSFDIVESSNIHSGYAWSIPKNDSQDYVTRVN